MFVLCFLFKSNSENLIIILFILDAVFGNLIVLSIYLLLTKIVKNEKMYSKKKLLEYTVTDLGLLISFFIIGISLANAFQYNILLIISTALVTVSAIISLFFKSPKTEEKFNFKQVIKDKILNIYLIYITFANTAYASALGMMALLLKNVIGLTVLQTSIFILFTSIAGDLFGYLALYKLTPKNDYLTFFFKFGIRFIGYFLIAITANKYVALVAIIISLLVSRAYENKTDGIYVNRLQQNNMLGFTTIKYGLGKLGTTLGVFVCASLFDYGLGAIFTASCVFMVFQLSFGYYAIYLRKKEEINLLKLDNNQNNIKI